LPLSEVFTAVDTGAKKELVTAMISKEIHRFSMPILLAAAAKESKVRSFQVVSYFDIVALLRKTRSTNTHEAERILFMRLV
jgi:hypothetical protein